MPFEDEFANNDSIFKKTYNALVLQAQRIKFEERLDFLCVAAAVMRADKIEREEMRLEQVYEALKAEEVRFKNQITSALTQAQTTGKLPQAEIQKWEKAIAANLVEIATLNYAWQVLAKEQQAVHVKWYDMHAPKAHAAVAKWEQELKRTGQAPLPENKVEQLIQALTPAAPAVILKPNHELLDTLKKLDNANRLLQHHMFETMAGLGGVMGELQAVACLGMEGNEILTGPALLAMHKKTKGVFDLGINIHKAADIIADDFKIMLKLDENRLAFAAELNELNGNMQRLAESVMYRPKPW